MAWRDLKLFFFYRFKKRLLGLSPNRMQNRSNRYAKGARPDEQNLGEQDYQTELSKEQIRRQHTEQGGQMQAGMDGGKNSDWIPDDIDLGPTSETGRLVRKLVTNISRRRKKGHKRKMVNVRTTIHHNMHNAGAMLKMSWLMKKPVTPRVVLIMDTSSSMLPSAKMMLQFLYALKKELKRIEVFIFGNQLNYVTPYLNQDFEHLMQDLSQLPQWNYGGTELWRPLSQLREGYSHLLTSRTVVIILTDCQFYEKFFALAPLERLRRRVKRLYLFNPHPQTRDLNDKYYQETINTFKTVVDHMFYTRTIHEVAMTLRQIM